MLLLFAAKSRRAGVETATPKVVVLTPARLHANVGAKHPGWRNQTCWIPDRVAARTAVLVASAAESRRIRIDHDATVVAKLLLLLLQIGQLSAAVSRSMLASPVPALSRSLNMGTKGVLTMLDQLP